MWTKITQIKNTTILDGANLQKNNSKIGSNNIEKWDRYIIVYVNINKDSNHKWGILSQNNAIEEQ